MKALYLIAGLCAAALSGCTVYPPTTTAYVSPPVRVAYVSPTYVAPPYTAVEVPYARPAQRRTAGAQLRRRARISSAARA